MSEELFLAGGGGGSRGGGVAANSGLIAQCYAFPFFWFMVPCVVANPDAPEKKSKLG